MIKTTVFLKDMNDFATVNKVYAEVSLASSASRGRLAAPFQPRLPGRPPHPPRQKFGDARPARAAIEVARLPKDVSVEIECVALAE